MISEKIFIAELIKFKEIENAYKESLETWGGDVPFLMVCADIGRSISNSFSGMSFDEKQKIFSLIEDAMNLRLKSQMQLLLDFWKLCT